MKFILSILLVSVLILLACSTTKNLNSDKSAPLAKAIQQHGGKKYQTASFAFNFRDRQYTFKNNGGQFEYTLQREKDGQQFFDVLNNNGFTRKIDGVQQELSEKDATRFGNSLNSVIYFAQIPYKLDDTAVTQKDRGTTTIKGKTYQVVEVTFSEEGGGTDHDDTFYYWVNQQTNELDYLAYKFHVDKGGVRFRSAYNKRRVGGILFQDYVNYKADKETPLADLPQLYESGNLEELSKIELKDIRKLN